jgi:hypothetical protein
MSVILYNTPQIVLMPMQDHTSAMKLETSANNL